ncbi:MAG: hypothetical protein M3Y27_10025 [Acidobacteriota bacterium]|nr:hypothetical protein [Acidobacteriota bacterium]
MKTPDWPARIEGGGRWRFLRDVLVFQLKLMLSGFRDLALVPVSLVAALIDVVFKGEREGSLFYRVLRWSWHSEEMINVYSPIQHEVAEIEVNPSYTVDAVVERIENVVVREYEKGGTAASIKAALDKVINQVHDETRTAAERAKKILGKS